ncbi:MAG: 30S ribosomal protein S2 [Candidatus Pacebacteria bacterium]|nr:30S ribosomal protein S2 [Candidatus Paceibacterota bacterium]MCF7862974.1 30S ribosomal protein S2 [Candidatus Paceibacterota bacterium]
MQKDITKTIEEMFAVGAHYGYSKSRRHPSTSTYIYTTKQSGDIINLEKTATLLQKAIDFMEKAGQEGKTILFVGTKPEAREMIKNTAESLEMPYVIERWIGGTISNFPEIKKRITELEDYRKDITEGNLEKYTKKERTVMAKKMERLSRYYSGLVGVKKIPDILFIIDSKKEHIATTEANSFSLPIVALLNSDSNIKDVTYPVLANDATVPSIKFFTKELSEAYKRGVSSPSAK